MSRILYLHGFASSPASNKARFFSKYLRDAGAQVEILDLADGDFEHLTLTRQLQVIERAAAAEPVALIGSSMGGYLAALYATRHPEATRIVLLAPAFCFARRWEERMGAAAIEEWRTTGTVSVFHYGDNRDRSLAYELLEDGRRYPDYPDFHQPALIFHGRHDDVVPAAFSEEFAAAHANARLEVLDSGHELTNVLDYMAPKVAEFLLPARSAVISASERRRCR
jgi:pimeloyl-ACP methyl ester carboxylesterase